MDLGISKKMAIVCASSKGLGLGCARALAEAGVDLVMCARGSDALESSAAAIRADFGVHVEEIVADITNEQERALVKSACPDADILVTNAGGPPPGYWSEWDREDFIAALNANMLSPIDMIKSMLPGMIQRRWGRIVNITSMSVKAPIGVLGLSNSARTGLTGYVAGTSRQVAQYGVTINNLLPGIHATDRAVSLDSSAASTEGKSIDEIKERRVNSIPARRYGTIEEFGAVCAFLCSDKAGYIVGQNILLDGGITNSTI